uniref:WxxW domain-containing protein n=1 Tax=Podarcis muralis TaxID=64176 RepID=A0A670IMW0_PODMU
MNSFSLSRLISASTCTTRWFDRDDPSGVGDFETLADLRREYPMDICPKPTGIEAQTVDGTPASSTGQIFHPFNTKEGFACVNKEQKYFCLDYKVRFTCPSNFCSGCMTQWFDRDDPSGRGDYELLSNLWSEYPGKICAEPLAINVQTLDGIPALKTGQKFSVYDPTQGFACINDEQKPGRSCHDYRVQFTCPGSFCSGEFHYESIGYFLLGGSGQWGWQTSLMIVLPNNSNNLLFISHPSGWVSPATLGGFQPSIKIQWSVKH